MIINKAILSEAYDWVLNIYYEYDSRSRHMCPLAFEALFQAQVIFSGQQVKVSIIWKRHRKRDKRFIDGFSLHLGVSFSFCNRM
jgi:hypothetical protein